MRGIGLGAMVGCAAVLLTAAPADARLHALEGSLTATGSVSVAWHGSAAGHCAAAGLCGYRGSTSVSPSDGGQLYIDPRGRRTYAFATLDSEDAPIVRVSRREPDGSEEACVDVAPPVEPDARVRVRDGRVRLRVVDAGLRVGRCAGPDLRAAVARLPAGHVSLARLKRGATTVDLSARVPFTSGRFSGTVTSSLRLHIGRLQREVVSEEEPPPPDRRRGRLTRVVEFHSVYRITALTGKLSATFHGLRDPICVAVDACGMSGVENWAIVSSGGTLLVEASALARRSDRGMAGLVAAVRRRGGRGYVYTSGDLRHEAGTTSARVDRSGATSCHDAHSTLPPPLFTQASRTHVVVALGEPEVYPGGPELLRTGCPGPTQAAALARQSIAGAFVPLRAFARRRIDVPLRAGGRFDDGGYAGTWRGRFALRLERVKQRLTYHYVRVPR
jgi:hypothetical protein